jgi:hypothetical protein
MKDWIADGILLIALVAFGVWFATAMTGWIFNTEPTEVMGTAVYKLIN